MCLILETNCCQKSNVFAGTFHNPSNLAIMTPNAKKKVLAYEKVPGSKDGQTRLTFC